MGLAPSGKQKRDVTPTDLEISHAWDEAAAMTKQVYATKVASYTRHDGSFGQPQPMPVPDFLEYTLRNSIEKESTADLNHNGIIDEGDFEEFMNGL